MMQLARKSSDTPAHALQCMVASAEDHQGQYARTQRFTFSQDVSE